MFIFFFFLVRSEKNIHELIKDLHFGHNLVMVMIEDFFSEIIQNILNEMNLQSVIGLRVLK